MPHLNSSCVIELNEILKTNFLSFFLVVQGGCSYVNCAKSLQSCSALCNPMDCSRPGSSVHGFSRQEYWSGLPGDLPDPGIKPVSLMSPVKASEFFTTEPLGSR